MSGLRRITGCAAAAALLTGAGIGAAAASEVRVVVSYYSAQTGPIFEAMAEEFEKANPDIDIQIEVVNWDNLEQKLTTDVAGGTAPDISIIGTRWLAGYVQEGIAEPLDEYMSDDFKAKFIETFMSPSVFDGQTYGLPVAASARAMYYNKAMFEQAGIAEPPATWDELKDAAAKIKALGNDIYGFGIQGKEIETDAYWYYAFWTHGGELLVDGKSGIASDAGVQAANLYKSMIDEGLTQPGVTGYNRENLQDLFKQEPARHPADRPLAARPDEGGGAGHRVRHRADSRGHDQGDLRRDRLDHHVLQLGGEGGRLEVPRRDGILRQMAPASSRSRKASSRCSSRKRRTRTSPTIPSWRRLPQCCRTPSSRRSSPTGKRWRTPRRGRCSRSISARRRRRRRSGRRPPGSTSSWNSKPRPGAGAIGRALRPAGR